MVQLLTYLLIEFGSLIVGERRGRGEGEGVRYSLKREAWGYKDLGVGSSDISALLYRSR